MEPQGNAPENKDDELNQIDKLENKLYDPRQKDLDVNLHTIHDHKASELPTSWGEATPVITPAQDQGGYSFGTKVLFVAIGILLVVLIFTAWRVFSGRNTVDPTSIDLTLDSRSYVEGGEVTPFSISVLNRNTIALEDAILTLSYEKGVGLQDEQAKVYERRVLGTVEPNVLKREDLTIVLYGAESDTRVISVKLEYKVAGANATFEKNANTSVVLKTPPVTLHVDGPSTLVKGQEGVFTVSLKNNTSAELLDSLVVVSLPTTFTLRTASPPSSGRGMVWNTPSLQSGATTTIKLYGSFNGEPGEVATIKASIGSRGESVNQIGVVYSQEGKGVMVTAPLLSLTMRLETDRGSASNLRYGDKAAVYITYQNKSDKVLSDAEIVAIVEGTAPVISGINSDAGYYNSFNRTVTWNSATNEELRSILPNASGEVRLFIPIVNKGTNSPRLSLTIKGTATSATKNDTATEISRSWNVEGTATFTAWTAYETSAVSNSGPIPPKVNTSTTYAVHMVASAQNALTNARVSFILPAYVTYTGVQGAGANVTYDERRRTVSWNIGTLSGGQVVSNDVQVSVRPSASHVGFTPTITSGLTFEADEVDSKAHIRTTAAALTTELTREGEGFNVSQVVAE